MIGPLLQRRSGARSSRAHRPGVSLARMRPVSRGSQPSNSARNSGIVAVAVHDSTASPAGANATRFTSRPAETG
ncbi:hypothetical protein LUW74_44395 [Actinomadura madurae]|nr:hypothetical protein [Actinomadura madurae]URN09701.1 hypothetical protein LUW74_44395 [Actinomadura madurae]